jgi:hypothetical protein
MKTHTQNPPQTTSRTCTHQLRESTIAALDALAAQTSLGKSAIVDALLTRALDQVSAGKWTIRRRAAAWELEDIEEINE